MFKSRLSTAREFRLICQFLS